MLHSCSSNICYAAAVQYMLHIWSFSICYTAAALVHVTQLQLQYMLCSSNSHICMLRICILSMLRNCSYSICYGAAALTCTTAIIIFCCFFYLGSSSRYYYRTPSKFFTGRELEKDEADTTQDFVYVLNEDGEIKRTTASGVRVFLPNIPDVGVIRQRYGNL